MLRKLLFGLVLIAAALAPMDCSINPATGRRQINLISQDQEIQLGAEAQPQFIKEYGGEIPSPAIQNYVSQIGQRLAKASPRPNLPWEFHVVDSSVLNAFALPGGKVFLTRGLISKMNNEAQLAGVLGHEVAHVTNEHIGQQMTSTMILQGLGAGLDLAAQHSSNDWMQVLGLGTQVGGGLYLLKFGRDQESESDEYGMIYMTKLGYSPLGQLQVMQILKKESKGGGGGLEMLSTHPMPDTRIDRIRQIINQRYPDANDTNRYRFNGEEFRVNMLDNLAKLPPPKHSGK